MANVNGIYVPFIVDVEGGMEYAAEKTEQEVKKLMDRMSKHSLRLRFDVSLDENSKDLKTVNQILTNSTMTTENLDKALKSVSERIEKLSKAGGFNIAKGLTEDEKELLQVFAVVAQKYEGTGLLLKGLMSDARDWAKQNAESAREVIEYWNKIDAIINTTGNSFREASERMNAAMRKLEVTPARLDDGGMNPEFSRLVDIVKEARKVVFDYQIQLSNVTNTSRENVEVLRQQEQTMHVLNMQMSEWRKILENSEVGGAEFKEAAEQMGILADATAKANYQFQIMSSQRDSIKQVSAKMAELNRQWSEAGASKKFNADGTLTAWAAEMVDKYKDLANYSEKYGHSLEQILAKRSELRAHAEALRSIGNTMNELNQSLSAWTSELNSARIDSPEWQNAAEHVRQLSEKIRETNEKLQEMGFKTGSIEQMNAKVQSLTRQWNELQRRFDASGAMTVDAKNIYNEYIKVTRELQKEGQSMSDILSKQDALMQKIHDEGRIRQRNQLILTSEVNTIDRIRQKIQLLTEKLGKTRIGTNKFKAISAEIDVLNKKLEEATGKTKQLNNEMGRSNSMLSNLLKKTAYLFGLHTIARFTQNIRKVTAEFELQQVALGAIIQDTERAGELFKQIKAAAIRSPFEIKDLVSYTKQLAAYQIETDKLFETTMKLADVSAGLGVDMQRLILAYGQVRAASVLRGQELRQFTEAGIPLVEKLAEKFSDLRGEMVTTGEVFQLISERAVPFSMIAEIFDDMTNAGGMFYKMQEKQAETLAGQWSNLKDSISIMYDEIGRTDEVRGALDFLIKNTRSLASNWKELLAVIKGTIATLLVYKVAASSSIAITNLTRKATHLARAEESLREKGLRRVITSIIGKSTAEKVSTIATNLHTVAMNRASAATTRLGAAFWHLTAAMASNPFSIIAAAASILIGVFIRLTSVTENLEDRINADAKAIQQFGKTTEEIPGMINRYEELSNVTHLTTQESKELEALSKSLAKIYPQAAKGIDQQTNAVTLLVSEMRNLNEEEEKAARRGLESTYRKRNAELRKIEKEFNIVSTALSTGVEITAGGISPIGDKRASKLYAEMVDLQNRKAQLIKDIQEIRDALDGVKPESGIDDTSLTAWREKILTFRKDLGETHIQIFGEDQVKNFTRLSDALDAAVQEYKKYDDIVKRLEPSLKNLTGKEKEEIEAQLARATTARELVRAMLEYYNALHLLNKKTSTGYTQDAYIKQTQERIKFMKDFQKGYENLNKYLTKSSSLAKESGIMLTRGLSLGLNAQEQKRAAEDLSQWYQDTIDKTFEHLQKEKGVSGTLTDFLSRRFTGNTDREKMLRDFQSLFQSLFDSKTDYDTSTAERNMEKAIEHLADDIKRSEIARKFYEDILGLTGDEKIAADMAISVYDTKGQDFKGRMQQELVRALSEIQPSQIPDSLKDELTADIAIFDTEAIKQKLNQLPPKIKEIFEKVLAANEQFDADYLKSFEQTYQRAKTYKQRIDIEDKKRETAINKAIKAGKSLAEISAINEKHDREIAKIEVEALKNSEEWIAAFENLDKVGTQTLQDLIVMIKKVIATSGADLEPESLKTLVKNLEDVENTLFKRNPFTEFSSGLKSYIDSLVGIRRARKALNQEDEKSEEVAWKLKASENQQRKALNQMQTSVQGLSDAFDNLNSIISIVSDMIDLDELSDGKAALNGIAWGLSAIGTALAFINGILTLMEANPIVLAITAATAALVSLYKVISNIKFNRIEKDIKRQQEMLNRLEYAYGRLEAAIQKAFGSDYITKYNNQLKILEAEQAAYLKMASLERDKGKKADKDKIKDYEERARDAADKIFDMRQQLAEFFVGTDVTSAARDFANAWIDAYKQFGSTTDAMREKFQDMIENMVTNSIAAKLMQTILQPLFDEIDKMARTEERLTPSEIAKIAQQSPAYIARINEAMTNLMNQLTAAGYNIRQQAGSFTGISRNIAGASEESITGLSAGINTQNFYMQHIDQTVSAILATIAGGATTAEGTPSTITDPYKEQMLLYMESLPQMRDDMATIRGLLAKVILPRGSASDYSVRVS